MKMMIFILHHLLFVGNYGLIEESSLITPEN